MPADTSLCDQIILKDSTVLYGRVWYGHTEPLRLRHLHYNQKKKIKHEDILSIRFGSKVLQSHKEKYPRYSDWIISGSAISLLGLILLAAAVIFISLIILFGEFFLILFLLAVSIPSIVIYFGLRTLIRGLKRKKELAWMKKMKHL